MAGFAHGAKKMAAEVAESEGQEVVQALFIDIGHHHVF
jgi:hypothetical protein